MGPLVYRLVPFAGLLLLLLVQRRNRRLGALAVGLSVGATLAILTCIELAIAYSRDMDTCLSVAQAVSIGFAAFWLLLGDSSRKRDLFWAAVAAIILGLGALMLDGKSGEDALMFALIALSCGMISFGLMVSLLRRGSTFARVMLWMPFICVATATLLVALLMAVTIACGVPVREIVIPLVTIGSVLGAATWALLVPYLLLVRFSPLYRARLAEISGTGLPLSEGGSGGQKNLE